jgi:hypothetical protein
MDLPAETSPRPKPIPDRAGDLSAGWTSAGGQFGPRLNFLIQQKLA